MESGDRSEASFLRRIAPVQLEERGKDLGAISVLEVRAFGDGLAPGIEPGETGSFHVRLQGNTTYELRVVPLNFRDDEPNGYTVEYAYEPLVDCYEANDTRETAKRIPLDTPIKAFLHPGIGPNSSRIVSFTADDWYWSSSPRSAP